MSARENPTWSIRHRMVALQWIAGKRDESRAAVGSPFPIPGFSSSIVRFQSRFYSTAARVASLTFVPRARAGLRHPALSAGA